MTQLYTDRTQMEVDPVDNDEQGEDTTEFDNARLEEEEELFYPDDVDFDDMRRDSSSDEEGDGVGDSDEVDEVEGFLVGLRLWAMDKTITSVNDLLRLMSINLPSLKGIPKTHKTLMKTPKERAPIRLVNPGKYTHFGIQNYMFNLTDELVLSQDEITIDLGIDGAPLANSSALQAWPIMGYICGSNLPVFDIGVYVGTKKPKSCCDFLKEYGVFC